MIDLTELYAHWWAGRSQVQIADSLWLDRKTVRKYLAPAVAAGIVPGGPPVMTEADWRERIAVWFPEMTDARLRAVTWPAIAVHRDYVMAQLKEGVTQATIHQRLRDEKGLDASVASFRRWVAANLPEEVRRARVRVLGPGAEPGSEAQIDYGQLGRWTDPGSGCRHTVWAFVMVLACSRHMFVRPVLRLDQQAWTRAHVEAFAFFGGVPARLVPDNLKTGVDKPDLYDPKINRSYGELAAHYATLIDPARAFKPRDKARVERPMPYVRDSFWRGREFVSEEAMQAGALVWCREVAGTRAHRGLDGAAPAVVFEAVEAGALMPLPRTRFTIATWSTGKIGPDIHVKVGPALYSVPWRLIGQRVSARSTATTVQIIHDQQVVATHLRADRGRRTNYDHYPPEKIAFAQRTPTWCRQTAAQVGPATTEVIAGLLEINALYRLRSAQGVLRLRETYTPARLETACARALAVGDPSYRTVKGLLAAGLQDTPAPAAAGDGGAAAFLHGPDQLFADVIPLPTPSGPPEAPDGDLDPAVGQGAVVSVAAAAARRVRS